MDDLNVLFLTAGQQCRREVLTCSPEENAVDAALRMREQKVSCLVVCERGIPVGILTDRDLRNKLVAQGMDPHDVSVSSVMTSPLITVSQDDQLLDAVLRMTRHQVHRMVVLDKQGCLAGIISDSDIYRLQKQSPHLLVREVEEAATIDELRRLHCRVQNLVAYLIGTGVKIQDLIRLIARLNDHILLRLIQVVRDECYVDLSDRFAFVVLGSQGRGEQTLTTDQDNALIHADDLTAAAVRRLAGFCREVVDGFVAIGIPSCPGNTMAANEFWRRSSAGWRMEVDRWFSSATLENIINVAMFCDMRTLYGDPGLEQGIKQHIAAHLGHNEFFLMKMAANVDRIPIPLNWRGQIKTETGDGRQGRLDIKRGGIFTITEGIKVLALDAKILDGGTLERIAGLVEAGTLNMAEADNLRTALDQFLALRLRFQVESLRDGLPPDNHIYLDRLNRVETGRLRLALVEVRAFQRLLKRHFQLGLAGV